MSVSFYHHRSPRLLQIIWNLFPRRRTFDWGAEFHVSHILMDVAWTMSCDITWPLDLLYLFKCCTIRPSAYNAKTVSKSDLSETTFISIHRFRAKIVQYHSQWSSFLEHASYWEASRVLGVFVHPTQYASHRWSERLYACNIYLGMAKQCQVLGTARKLIRRCTRGKLYIRYRRTFWYPPAFACTSLIWNESTSLN